MGTRRIGGRISDQVYGAKICSGDYGWIEWNTVTGTHVIRNRKDLPSFREEQIRMKISTGVRCSACLGSVAYFYVYVWD